VLISTTIIMLALTAATFAAARNALFPPVLFCGTWSLILAGLLVAGRALYPVSDYALLVFAVGAVAFSLGSLSVLCLCGEAISSTQRTEGTRPLTRLALDVALVMLIAAFPLYLRTALDIAGTGELGLILSAVRRELVESGDNPFGPVASNLNVLAPLIAIAMCYETDGSWSRRLRAITATILALAYNSLTGSKGGLFLLVILFFLAQIRAQRLKVGHAAAAFAFLVSGLMAMILAVNFAGFSFDDATSMTRDVATSAASYVLGAPVSFGMIAEQPDTLASSENIGRFFVESARSLGLHVDVPSIFEQYTLIGPGISNNTYTIYFSYFKDYGWCGMVLLILTLGMMLSVVWRRAMRGAPVAVLMYSILCKDIVQSFYAESFYISLNSLIKSFALFWFLYTFLPALRRTHVVPVRA